VARTCEQLPPEHASGRQLFASHEPPIWEVDVTSMYSVATATTCFFNLFLAGETLA